MPRLRVLALLLRPLLAAVLGVTHAACVLDDVDLEGRACPCAPGFECELSTRTCMVAGSTGTPDAGLEDAGLPEPCTFDQECGDGPERVCVAGFCRTGCASGGEVCSPPATCDEPSGHCLVEGACDSASECAAPLSVCLAGRCSPGCTVSTGACRLDRVCEPSTGVCGPSPKCGDQLTCPDTHWCDGTSCRRRCTEPGSPPCRGDSSCNSDTGRCDGGLELGEDCGEDRACASGECLRVQRGLIRYAFCGRSCGASSDCPLGLACVPVSAAGQCIPTRVLTSDNPRTLRSGDSCDLSDNRCQSGFCESASCVELCSRDLDCAAFGNACVAAVQDLGGGNRTLIPRCLPPFVGGAAGATCQSNLDCAGGLCDPDLSTCARLCCAERDCEDGQACVALQTEGATLRVCRPRSGVGTRVLGAPCDQDADCRSEVCGPADASNPMGARICTTYCCIDPDCDALPSGGRCSTSEGPFPSTALGRCVR